MRLILDHIVYRITLNSSVTDNKLFPTSNQAVYGLYILTITVIIAVRLFMRGKVAVSWLKIVGLGLGLAARILSHETATLPHPASSIDMDTYKWDWRHSSPE